MFTKYLVCAAVLLVAVGACFVGLAKRWEHNLLGAQRQEHAQFVALEARLEALQTGQAKLELLLADQLAATERCARVPVADALPVASAVPTERRELEPKPEPAAEPSPESVALAQTTAAAVDAAIAAHTWREVDKVALRNAMGKMAPAASDEILRKLVVAVNAGEVRPEVRGGLF